LGGGMNRHFQTKRTKYSNFHIIETIFLENRKITAS